MDIARLLSLPAGHADLRNLTSYTIEDRGRLFIEATKINAAVARILVKPAIGIPDRARVEGLYFAIVNHFGGLVGSIVSNQTLYAAILERASLEAAKQGNEEISSVIRRALPKREVKEFPAEEALCLWDSLPHKPSSITEKAATTLPTSPPPEGFSMVLSEEALKTFPRYSLADRVGNWIREQTTKTSL